MRSHTEYVSCWQSTKRGVFINSLRFTYHILHPNIHPGSQFQFSHNSNTLTIYGHKPPTQNTYTHARTYQHLYSHTLESKTPGYRRLYGKLSLRFGHIQHRRSSSKRQASPTAPPHSRNTNHVFSQFIPHPTEPTRVVGSRFANAPVLNPLNSGSSAPHSRHS